MGLLLPLPSAVPAALARGRGRGAAGARLRPALQLIRAQTNQESVPASLDDTALCRPATAGDASEPCTPSGAQDRPQAIEPAASAGLPPSALEAGRTQHHVDMIVPPHYSAAPSGDLCTTLRLSFVVRGESGTSVPTTGDRPQPFRSRTGLPAVAQSCTPPRQRICVQASRARASDSKQYDVSLMVRAMVSVCARGAVFVCPRGARKATPLDQLKHDRCDARSNRIFRAIHASGVNARRSAVSRLRAGVPHELPHESPHRAVPRGSAPRNRIFT